MEDASEQDASRPSLRRYLGEGGIDGLNLSFAEMSPGFLYDSNRSGADARAVSDSGTRGAL